MSGESEARGMILDAMVCQLGIERERRWSWSPTWLHVWPFWESNRAFRYRAFALTMLARHAGTEFGICGAVAVALGCKATRVRVQEDLLDYCGPERPSMQFVVKVRRWRPLTAGEKQRALAAVNRMRPAYTRCIDIEREV